MTKEKFDKEGRDALSDYINGLPTEKAREWANALAAHHLNRDNDAGGRIYEPTFKGKPPASVDLDGARSVILDKVAAIRAAEGDNSLALRHALGLINRAFSTMPFGGSCRFESANLRAGRELDPVAELKRIAGNLERLRDVLAGHVTDDEARDRELHRLDGIVSGAAGFFAEVVARSGAARFETDEVELAPARSLGIPVGDLGLGRGNE